MSKLVIETEVYSRVVGYYRPSKQWNKGKQEEFAERKTISRNSTSIFTSSSGAKMDASPA